MSDAACLAELFHHKWSVPILARLHGSGGARVAELAAALDASRGGVSQALVALEGLGFVARNEGHGHPLRPEFLLTREGERIATAARRFVEQARDLSLGDQAHRKWPMPVLYGLGETGARFSELRRELPSITDRALSQTLQGLETALLADRIVRPERPVRVSYRPTGRAFSLRPTLRALI